MNVVMQGTRHDSWEADSVDMRDMGLDAEEELYSAHDAHY